MTEAVQAKMNFEPGRAWGWVLVSGILSTVLGVVILASSPVAKGWLLAIWIGVSFLLTGVQRLVLAAAEQEDRGWAVVGGIVMLGMALAIFVWPGETLWVLAIFAGVAALLGGILDIIMGLAGRSQDRALALVRGLISAVIGVVILAWPAQTLLVIAILFGAFLLVQGIFMIFAAFGLRRMSQELEKEGLSGSVVTVTTAQDESGNAVQAVDVQPIPSKNAPPPQAAAEVDPPPASGPKQ